MGLDPGFVATLVEDARAHEDWTYAVQVLWDAFEKAAERDLPCPSEERGKLDSEGFISPVPPLWEEGYRVLAEALLAQGDLARAEVVVQWVARQEPLKQNLPLFLELGRKHAGEATAQRWKRYGESPCGVEEAPVAREIRRAFWGRPLTILLWGPDADRLKQAGETLRSDAGLDEYPVSALLLEVTTQSARGMELARWYGWKEGTRWAVVDRQGRLSEEGMGIPSQEVLQETFSKHHLIQEIPYLDAWIKGHPDDLSTWERYLKTVAGVAERRTRRLLGLSQPTVPESGGIILLDGTFLKPEGTTQIPQPAPRRDLTEAEDEATWSSYCQALQTFFEEGDSALVERSRFSSRRTAAEMGGTLIPPLTVCSPKCRALFASLLPRVESALERAPSRGRLWMYWKAFARATKAPLLPLLKRLVPNPLDEETWPPPGLRKEVIQAYLADRAYDEVLSICRPSLEELYGLRGKYGEFASSQGNLINEPQWRELGAPSFEALVASGRTDEALDLLKQWLRQGGWKGAVESCIEIAGGLKGDALAVQLRRLA